jgi:hypothetical protein
MGQSKSFATKLLTIAGAAAQCFLHEPSILADFGCLICSKAHSFVVGWLMSIVDPENWTTG